MTASYNTILYDVNDPVATLTLNRPGALNAWTFEMGAEIDDALARATDDSRVVGIVITGSGRAFCAGADMSLLAETKSGVGMRPAPPTAGDPEWGADFRGTFTSILSIPKPTIAAINGPVAGMALALALACDVRYIAPDAKVTTAFATRGLIAEWGTSWLLPRLIGSGHALDLLLSCRVVTGTEAVGMGLANRVVQGSVVAAAQEYVRFVAERCSPASMAVIKRQVYTQLHAGLADAERQAVDAMEHSLSTRDFKEGAASYFDKRPPSFPRLGGGSVKHSTNSATDEPSVNVKESPFSRPNPSLIVLGGGATEDFDLVIPACQATPEIVSFIVRNTSGFLCAALSAEEADRLQLPFMERFPTGTPSAAWFYGVSVDFDQGSTGISASDRARTARALADPTTTPDQFTRPGHLIPLRIPKETVAGYPERGALAVEMVRTAGLPPVALMATLVRSDRSGSVMDANDARAFARIHQLGFYQ